MAKVFVLWFDPVEVEISMLSDMEYSSLKSRYRDLQLRKEQAWEYAERLRKQYEAAHETYLSLVRQENKAMIDLGDANEEHGAWRSREPVSIRTPSGKRKTFLSRYLRR